MYVKTFFGLLGIFFLSSCTMTPQVSSGTNMVCAFVEGYVDTKSLVLTSSPAQAENYMQTLIPTPKNLSSTTALSDEESQILLDFRNAMVTWSASYALYFATGNKESFTQSEKNLESSIDQVAQKCENKGWKFKTGWRA